MGFFDFLKGILPEKLINLDFRKITVNNQGVIIGNENINDPKLVDEIFNKISEYQNAQSLPAQILHKNLDEPYSDYELISIEHGHSIKKLKSVLSDDDLRCILMARQVKKAYDKSSSQAKELHSNLEKNFPNKGNKVFNLISAGYFDEMILPFIDVFKIEYEESYVEKFQSFYADIIKFFPLAFFVGNHTTKEKLIEEINKRLNLKDVPFIKIHAIGKQNITKVKEGLDELGVEEIHTTKFDTFTCSNGLRAQICEIKLKKH